MCNYAANFRQMSLTGNVEYKQLYKYNQLRMTKGQKFNPNNPGVSHTYAGKLYLKNGLN